jgi:hypothetical protein
MSRDVRCGDCELEGEGEGGDRDRGLMGLGGGGGQRLERPSLRAVVGKEGREVMGLAGNGPVWGRKEVAGGKGCNHFLSCLFFSPVTCSADSPAASLALIDKRVQQHSHDRRMPIPPLAFPLAPSLLPPRPAVPTRRLRPLR